MNPGIARNRLEWSRFWRRLSLLATLTSILFAAPFLAFMYSPELRDTVLDAKRFGFEGLEQYVRRIQLTSLGDPRGGRSTSRMIEPEILPEQQRGGGSSDARKSDVGTPVVPNESFRPPGIGDSEEDILARAMLRAGDKPLFQSRELVIERLVEPEYPELARARGIEGRVAVLALVDQAGVVREAQIVGTAGEAILERAAIEAVLQCRFRPYTLNGEAQEIYAMFRFAFRLLN